VIHRHALNWIPTEALGATQSGADTTRSDNSAARYRLSAQPPHDVLASRAYRLPSEVNSPSFLRSFIFSSCTSFSAVTLSASTLASCAAARTPCQARW